MKKTLMLAAVCAAMAAPVRAENVSVLTGQGLVMLSSHFNAENKVVTMVLGTVNGAPEYICETRYRVKENDSYDDCRKFR